MPTNKLSTSTPLAREREANAKEEIAKLLVAKGLKPTDAKQTASEIVAAGFCIVGGGVPL